MALNPELISLFIRNIEGANMKTFGSEVAHLFEHLDNEIKDNQIYDKYLNERDRWKTWPGDDSVQWRLPTKFEEAKSLIFNLYHNVGDLGEEGYSLPKELTSEIHGNTDNAIHSFNNHFLDYFKEVINEIVAANPEIEYNTAEKINGKTVFIIHGHDDGLKTEIQLLLIRAGVNNIVLHEQPDKGRTIIDKLVEESFDSNYAIALLSPDDILIDGSKRARQNVIFEIGFFLGRLGKERVRIL